MRILIVQTSFLGDTILSTPVIAAVSKKHPGAEIWMMTTPASAELVKRDPLIKEVIAFDKRRTHSGARGFFRMVAFLKEKKFDIAYSLHRSARTSMLLAAARIPRRIGFDIAKMRWLFHETRPRDRAQHDVLRNLSLVEPEPQMEFSDELRLFTPDISEVSESISRISTRRFVVLFPGSAWKTKMWHWEGYREAAIHLKRSGFDIVLLGAEKEVPVCNSVAEGTDFINLAGKVSLTESMFLVSRANLVICNDSMALHMASAFKVPTVAVFCATSPSFGFSPWKNRAVVVEREGLPCKPCSRHGGKTCPVGTEACMREVSPREVIRAAEDLFAQ